MQINPIWLWGPYETALGTNGAQPDWYLGWLIGGLRLMPGFDVTIGGHTIDPEPVLGRRAVPRHRVPACSRVWPWIERRITGDRRAHNLLDRPRDAPCRTAFGVGFLAWVFLVFFAGSADRLFVFLGLAYQTQIWFWRFGVWVFPVLLAVATFRLCRALQRAEQVEATRARAEEQARRGDPPVGVPASPP